MSDKYSMSCPKCHTKVYDENGDSIDNPCEHTLFYANIPVDGDIDNGFSILCSQKDIRKEIKKLANKNKDAQYEFPIIWQALKNTLSKYHNTHIRSNYIYNPSGSYRVVCAFIS